MNDGGAPDGKHGRADQATLCNELQGWGYVSKVTCAKIVGGTVANIKPEKQ